LSLFIFLALALFNLKNFTNYVFYNFHYLAVAGVPFDDTKGSSANAIKMYGAT
jgi:hypothetical protein